MSEGGFRFGSSAFRLDPPLGLSMDGYADRVGVAESHLDPLLGRVWHLESGPVALTLVALEVLGVSSVWTGRARERIREALQEDEHTVIIAATHTHAGPRGFVEYPTGREEEVTYAECVLGAVAKAAMSARENRCEAGALVRPFSLSGVASNRVEADATAAGSGLAFQLQDAGSGSALGYLLSVGCHSTVLGADNTAYSGDLFGAVTREVESVSGVACAIVTGAAADVSTRFVRQRSSYEEAVRLGRLLAKAAKPNDYPKDGRTSCRLATSVRTIQVPTRRLPSVDEARAILVQLEEEHAMEREGGAPEARMRLAWTRVQGARLQLQQASRGGFPRDVPFELVGVRIGNGALVAVPAEVPDAAYREWRREWQQEYPWALATLANGYEGYFPVSDARSYETMVAPFDAISLDVLKEGVRDVLRNLGAVT